MFMDSCTSSFAVPRFSCPRCVSLETIEEIMASKVSIHGDHVQRQPVGANAHAGVVGVQTLHCLICEIHLPT